MCVVAKDVPFSSISSCSSLKDFEVVELDIPSSDYGRDQKALEIPLHLSERLSHDYGKNHAYGYYLWPCNSEEQRFSYVLSATELHATSWSLDRSYAGKGKKWVCQIGELCVMQVASLPHFSYICHALPHCHVYLHLDFFLSFFMCNT